MKQAELETRRAAEQARAQVEVSYKATLEADIGKREAEAKAAAALARKQAEQATQRRQAAEERMRSVMKSAEKRVRQTTIHATAGNN